MTGSRVHCVFCGVRGGAPAERYERACAPCYLENVAPQPGARWLAALRFLGPDSPRGYAAAMLEWLEDAEIDARRQMQANAIRATLEGYSAPVIAARLEVTPRTVVRWRAAWRRGGWRALVAGRLPRVVREVLDEGS